MQYLPFLATALFAQVDAMPYRAASGWQTLTMAAIALVFFYFILWRPEQQKRKEADAKREAMCRGDRVIAVGIVGTVDKVQETTVIVKMIDGTKIEFLKTAISEVTSVEKEGK